MKRRRKTRHVHGARGKCRHGPEEASFLHRDKVCGLPRDARVCDVDGASQVGSRRQAGTFFWCLEGHSFLFRTIPTYGSVHAVYWRVRVIAANGNGQCSSRDRVHCERLHWHCSCLSHSKVRVLTNPDAQVTKSKIAHANYSSSHSRTTPGRYRAP